MAADDQVSLVLIQQPLQLLPATARRGRMQHFAKFATKAMRRQQHAPAPLLAGWLGTGRRVPRNCCRGATNAGEQGCRQLRAAPTSGGLPLRGLICEDTPHTCRGIKQAKRSRQKSAGVRDLPTGLLGMHCLVARGQPGAEAGLPGRLWQEGCGGWKALLQAAQQAVLTWACAC